MAEQRDERTAVKTYVPGSQKEEWQADAEDLDMSLSEFVRTMVQAGRRGFDGSTADGADSTVEEPSRGDATPGGDPVETAVLEVLDEEAVAADELVERVVGEMEERVIDAVESLEDRNRIAHDLRAGGYRVVGE